MYDSIINMVGIGIIVTLLVLLKSCKSVGYDSNYTPIQYPDYPNRYSEYLEPTETKINEKYQYVLTKSKDRYIYRRFFPETYTLTLYEEYIDEDLSYRDGIYEVYWDNGKLKILGRYEADKRSGFWEFYNYEGKVSEEGEYNNGLKSGIWLDNDYYGRLKSRYSYLNGELHGEQVYYDSTGNVLNIELYEGGEFIKEKNRDFAYSYEENDNSSEEKFKVVEKMPLFSGCPKRFDYARKKKCADKKLLQFIYSNIKYPVDARTNGVVGSAKVSFTIERDGSVSDIRVLNGLNQSITNELVRIVGLMPVWEPGIQDGEPVRVQFNLPINFN